MRGSKIVPVRFPATELSRLDRLATAAGCSRSGVIRLALDKLDSGAYHNDSATRTHDDAPATTVENPASSSGVPPVVAVLLPLPDDIDALLAELDVL